MHGPDQDDPTGSARREALLDRVERATELPLMILSFALLPLLAAPLLWELRPTSQAVAIACCSRSPARSEYSGSCAMARAPTAAGCGSRMSISWAPTPSASCS